MPSKKKRPPARQEGQPSGQQTQRAVLTQEWHIGPYPHPQLLQQYDAVFPGAAHRIFQYTEREQESRHALQREELGHEASFLLQGQRLVFFLLIAMVGIGGWLASLGLTFWAIAFVTPALGNLVRTMMSHPNRPAEAPPAQPERPSLPPPGKGHPPALPG